MHELYLAESILHIITDYEKRNGFKKVNSMCLSYGRLSCVDPKTLQFAFGVQAKNTVAEGAKLNFQVLPAIIHCFSCEKDIEVQTITGNCPDCSSLDVLLVAGTEELKILELDVD